MPSNLFGFRTYDALAPEGSVPFNSYADFHANWFWLTYNNTSDLINYYANLLIIQYIGKPKAYATIQTMVTPVIMDQLPLIVQNAFNLLGIDTAVGSQLDTLGKYAGVTRTGYGFFGPITLDDMDFLKLIQMAIVKNTAGSSLAGIQLYLNLFFPNEVFIFDYADMNISYLINTSIGSQNLIDIFITENLLPKPMGVGASVIAHNVINKFFALRTYAAPASANTTPLNSYASYQTSWLSMSYAYAIPI